jgi:hypothetical protein
MRDRGGLCGSSPGDRGPMPEAGLLAGNDEGLTAGIAGGGLQIDLWLRRIMSSWDVPGWAVPNGPADERRWVAPVREPLQVVRWLGEQP